MKKNRLHRKLIAAAILLIAIIFVPRIQNRYFPIVPPVAPQNPTPTNEPIINKQDISNWKTFKGKNWKIQFRYNDVYQIDSQTDDTLILDDHFKERHDHCQKDPSCVSNTFTIKKIDGMTIEEFRHTDREFANKVIRTPDLVIEDHEDCHCYTMDKITIKGESIQQLWYHVNHDRGYRVVLAHPRKKILYEFVTNGDAGVMFDFKDLTDSIVFSD